MLELHENGPPIPGAEALAAAALVLGGIVQCGLSAENLSPRMRAVDELPESEAARVAGSGPPPRPSPGVERLPSAKGPGTPFPYLPSEDRDVSRSIGGVVHGHLVEAAELPRPHPDLGVLQTQHERDLDYATDRLVSVLEEAAAHVREAYPESVVWLGNLGRRRGGDIPYSVSHNSGRDADLAFFAERGDGTEVVPSDLVRFDAEGEGEVGGEPAFFDVARNWRLVSGLVRAAGDQLQYIFVSRPLRAKLLERARAVDAPARLVERASRVLHQPTGSLPHADHFHVRLYCSEVDVASGCRDDGHEWPWYDDHADARRETTQRALELLESGESADVRAAAARRLGVLRAEGAASSLVATVDDPDPAVRLATARSLARLGRGSEALADRLQEESDPHALAEQADALARLGDRVAVAGLVEALDRSISLALPGGPAVPSRAVLARRLGRTESAAPVEPLVELLDSERAKVRSAAARALRFSTNHHFGGEFAESPDPDAVERWRAWWRQYGEESRGRWLARGFRRAGFDVESLDTPAIWELCRAVDRADHLSYNAQRTLMRLSGRHPESLSWPKEDASFYWRRYFERREARYGLAEIPDGMSTLDDG